MFNYSKSFWKGGSAIAANAPSPSTPPATHSSARVVSGLSSDPKTSCPAMLPSRPVAASSPIAEVRSSVGKLSVDKQSREFHEHVDMALREQAASSTVTSVFAKEKATAEAQEAIKEPQSSPFRPTLSISSADTMLPGRFAADTKKESW